MRIRSTLGKGTTVVVRLPINPTTATPDGPVIASPPLADYSPALV
jgi:hypothetical protein